MTNPTQTPAGRPAPLPRKTAAAVAAGTLTVVLGAAGLAAADGAEPSGSSKDAYASVAETVQVVLDADGKVSASRLLTQVTASGDGTVDLDVPSPSGLRDLNGYSAPSVSDGQARYRLSPEGGDVQTRTVGEFDKDLPVTVEVDYTLDGKPVQADDIVGRSGVLVATYHIENTTAAERTVTYTGGDGKEVTETIKTVIPLVGTLATTLPGRFTEVSAPDAAVGGNGRGDNQVQWSLVLFDPVGAPTADVSYTAHITDGEIPATKLQLAVVAPQDMATTRSAGEQYAAGAETGAALTEGATQIDENLLKLKDGAGQLLAGLQKLSDGASQLSDGLNGQALPGSEKLADGAAELSAGLNEKAVPGSKKLADGASELSKGLNRKALPGSGQLAGGASKLHEGASDLSAGLDTLAGGLTTLNGKLPGAVTAVNSLTAGADRLLAGLGAESDAASLIGGAHKLTLGLDNPGYNPANPATYGAKQGVDAAKSGADQVKAGLDDALKTGGSIDQLAGGVAALKGFCSGLPDPTACTGTANAVLAGITGPDGLRAKTTAASGGLAQVSGGLGNVSGGLATAAAGAGTIEGGLKQLKTGVSNPAATADTSTWGLKQGLVGLASALTEAVTGVGQLSAGANAASAGGQQVAGGAGQLSDGAAGLHDGLGDAAKGSAQLADGSQALADGLTPAGAGAELLAGGAGELAKGLAPAGDGARRIAAGLAQATPGAAQIEDGAGRLSTEGTQKLVEAGEETAATFGSKYGQIVALNERAAESQLAYGNVADGADEQTSVFSYELAGANAEPQDNLLRGIVALGALVAGAAVAAAARRFRRAA